jgi:hypothetical protein
VRGQFWYDFLSPEAQKKAVILNGVQQALVETGKEGANTEKHILFLTAPYISATLNIAERDELLHVVLESAIALKRTLLVRVHPLESIGDYRSVLEPMQASSTLKVEVAYSQGPGLEAAVANASVAVTFCSTVFLDCLRHSVPIVSFGWHQFSYKNLISAYGIFKFANSLEHLTQLIEESCLNEGEERSSRYNEVLAPTTEAELKAQFAVITKQEGR